MVILTEWEDFRHLDLVVLKSKMRRPRVVDLRNMMQAEEMAQNGFDYCCVGMKS